MGQLKLSMVICKVNSFLITSFSCLVRHKIWDKGSVETQVPGEWDSSELSMNGSLPANPRSWLSRVLSRFCIWLPTWHPEATPYSVSPFQEKHFLQRIGPVNISPEDCPKQDQSFISYSVPLAFPGRWNWLSNVNLIISNQRGEKIT